MPNRSPCRSARFSTFPPDFDPSKIKRRKGLKRDAQITVRLMAPFSMRCERCSEYIYKGKKFNARKETATDEEYYGIKIFRFYIKCPTCSSEITFKTDPKNADYVMEHGAKRNFENWTDGNDQLKRLGAMPNAADDEDYDSDGNLREEAKERDAMADLERAQEQSRVEMEIMDNLADLRQRNARLEQSGAVDHDALLSNLHVERVSAEEAARRTAEQDEDDALVAQYFSKVPAGPPGPVSKGKAKAKAVDVSAPDVGEAGAPDGDDSDEDTVLPAALTIKRKPAQGGAEPSVQALLAARGKLDAAPPAPPVVAAAQVKRKREGMQKLLGIKKKAKA
ncbi:Pre-mRNA-splicing factor cwf16 [Cryptotrichosporon argae]